MNVTARQKEILINNLKSHAELVRGRVNRKNESKRKLNDMWNKITEHINASNEGPQKSGQEWAKTWKDMKSYILKKEVRRRSYIQGTGGGPPPQIFLSSFEEEVLEFLTPEAAGLQNIPEGGILETAEETQTLSECCSTSQINQFTSHDKKNQFIIYHIACCKFKK
ncbi:uncharacterized protein LOC116852463 [Odontomachus brunneus]|uniref:uncharacterized protein LOC116852463 n=1 Tax=Odontomachus brunneus TaxID=486640 RepID=UPI0013F25FB4|nr:uncharacterized protein LOC116852463 [Odontomachus brunneus]